MTARWQWGGQLTIGRATEKIKVVKFQKAEVARVFERYPAPVRKHLLRVRELIFEVAAATAGVGPLEEALRWGEPSYLTTQSGSGTMVRIHQLRGRDDALGIYVHCQTRLIATFRSRYPRKLKFEGNRAIVLDVADELPLAELRRCIALALTYFQKPARRARP
jgi:hypothetical protein